jgi:hypothetical protein
MDPMEAKIAEFRVSLTNEPNVEKDGKNSWDGKNSEKLALLMALKRVGIALSREYKDLGYDYSITKAFTTAFNSLHILMCNDGKCNKWDAGKNKYVRDVRSGMITYGHKTIGVSGGLSSGLSLVNNFIHELGHVFNNTVGGAAADAMDE